MKRGLRACDLVGSLTPGICPLEGKSFYLDEVKSRPSSIITEVIGRLGGRVESFLHRDVSVVVTANREAVTDGPLERSPAVVGKSKAEAVCSPRLQREFVNSAQRPGTPRPPVCGSRGKALLEKAIRNNEKSRGSALTNARSWGVKIVGVEDFLRIVDQLTVELSAHRNKRTEKKAGECPRVTKAGSLKDDFLKVEDSSRKYRPLHTQSLSFAMLSYTGKFSPFEPPAPSRPKKRKEGDDKLRKSDESISSYDKPSTLLPQTPSPRRPRKKSFGFCECCQISYKDHDQHLQSDLHRHFVEDITNYAVVDQLVAGMGAGFSCLPEQQEDKELMRLPSCSPAPVSPSVEDEEQMETERVSQTALNQSSDHLLADMDTVTANQPQETDRDLPSETSVEARSVAEKVNIHMLFQPKPETHIPSHCPEDVPCIIADNEPLPQIPVPPTQTTGDDGLTVSPAEKVADCVCPGHFLSPEPSQQPKLEKSEGSSGSSNSPKEQLGDDGVEKAAIYEQRDTIMVVEPNLNVHLTEKDQCSKRKSLVDVSSSCSVSSYCSMTFLTTVNPRKRSRSFTLTPKASKKIRTSHWSGQRSDPTDNNSEVSLALNFTPIVCSGLWSVAQKHEANGTEANCASVQYKLEACEQDLLLSAMQISRLSDITVTKDCLSFQQDQHSNGRSDDVPITEQYPHTTTELGSHVGAVNDHGKSSELGPPQLYPFYHDDIYQRHQPPFPDPPTLFPAAPLPTPVEKVIQPPACQASSTSLLSQSFSSVCIESALIPDFAFSPASSESDWDCGLLSRLAPTVHLPPHGARCELDLGLLLQRSCAGVQDGSYTSQLCSVLQPSIASPSGFEDSVNLSSIYRPIETMDRRIIQSLGV